MSKIPAPSKIGEMFRRKNKLTTITNCEWLVLTRKETRRRITFHVSIPYYKDIEGVNDSAYVIPILTVPRNRRVKAEVYELFDPARNREVDNENNYATWKFRTREDAEALIAYAMLKWPDNSWHEDDPDWHK